VDTAAKWFGMVAEGQSAQDANGTAIAEGATADPADTLAARPSPAGADSGSVQG
jgi:tryptophan synthase beta chain